MKVVTWQQPGLQGLRLL